VKKHGGAFPGRNELARIIGCSQATMTKAIKQSDYLKARAAEAKKSSIREVQLQTPIDRAPAGDDSAPRRSDLDGNNGQAEAEPLDAYHAGGDEEDDPADTVHKLAAQQRAELMREERQRRRAAKDGKLKE
jgi:DNA-binding transcriptional MocR family regulator